MKALPLYPEQIVQRFRKPYRQIGRVIRTLITTLLVASLLAGLIPPPAIEGLVSHVATHTKDLTGFQNLSGLADALPEPARAKAAPALAPQPQLTTCGTAPGDLGGTLWSDLDSDGVQDGGEPVFDGTNNGPVIVTAYDNNGFVAQDTVGTDGTYNFDNLFDGRTGDDAHIRLEFSGLPAWVSGGVHGANSGTTVQFYDAPSCSADLGVVASNNACAAPANALVNTYNTVATCSVYDEGSTRFVIGIEQTGNLTYAAATQTPSMFMHPDWTVDVLGSLYFTELDNEGYIYAPASEFTGTDINFAVVQQWGSLGGANGDRVIYRLDNVTGAPSVWATLPGGTNVNGTEGLGGITYDGRTGNMYVVNMGDATIYRLDGNGTTLSTYQPSPATLGTDTFTDVSGTYTFQSVPFGLDINPADGRLYYTVHDAGPNGYGEVVVRSVALDANGDFVAGSDREDIHEVVPHIYLVALDVRHYTSVVADIDFTSDGRMAVGNFTSLGHTDFSILNYYNNGDGRTLYNHDTGNYIFDYSGGSWTRTAWTTAGQETPGSLVNGTATGGVAWDRDGTLLWMSGADFANEDSNWGVIGYDVSQLDNGEDQEDASNYIQYLFPGQPTGDPKGNGGDVDVYSCRELPIEVGNYVWQDDDGDGIQDPSESGLDGVTVTLTCGSDSTSVVTTNGGQYYFGNGTNYDDGASNKALATWMDAGESCTISVSDQAITGGTSATNDLHDNDADSSGVVNFTVGQDGESNHTFDIGVVSQGTLSVTKVVVNDDGTGTSAVGDFTLTVDGGVGNVTSSTAISVTVGTYTVSESGPAGYTATFGGDCDASGSVTVTDGGSASCTITNDDLAATDGTLTVNKVVINDDGTGTSVVGDFTLTVDGGVGNVTSGATNAVPAGTYNISESGPAGYTATFSGDCDGAGSVTVVAGNAATCTITNNDISAAEGTITFVKNTAGADGTFTFASADGDLGGLSMTTASNTATSATFAKTPGSYVVTEDAQTGWAVADIEVAGDPDYGSTWSIANRQITIDLDAGENIVVTWTNADEDYSVNSVSLAEGPVAAGVAFQVVQPPESLGFKKTLVSPANGIAMVGDTLTFALHITNTGTSAVTELNLVDRYDPTILQYITASITPDSQTAGTITWTGNFGTGTGSFLPNLPLAPGASFTVTVEMEVIAPTRP